MKNIPAILEARAKLFKVTRKFFDERGYLEVDTPILYPYRDMTVHLADFTTRYADGQTERILSLPTSPEVYMKRLLADGAEKIYQLCHFFRNGEVTQKHNPEFMGLEFYEVGADYGRIMDITTDYLKAVFSAFGISELNYNGMRCELEGEWERATLAKTVKKFSGVDIRGKTEIETLRREIETKGYLAAPDDSYDDLFFRAYLTDVEPNLGAPRPIWIYEYPRQMAAYARLKPNDPDMAERCELYICGVELANGYGELNDAKEQRKRFIEAAKEKGRASDEEFPLDEKFLAAVEKMPDCSGIALGLERVLMLLLDKYEIGGAIPYPFGE